MTLERQEPPHTSEVCLPNLAPTTFAHAFRTSKIYVSDDEWHILPTSCTFLRQRRYGALRSHLTSMDHLFARAAIQGTIHRLAYAEDELDRTAFMNLLIPDQTFTFDVSNHMQNLPPTETRPEELFESAYQHLAGFKATQHMVGNMLITFENKGLTQARVKCQVRAYHCLEVEGRFERVTNYGLWLLDVEL